MGRKKISVIGAGNVGATTAHLTALKELGDVVLVDIAEGLPQGKGLDMLQSGPIEGFDVNIKGTNNYDDTKNSDIVIITAGLPRKPGMSRDDLISTNSKIMKSVVENVAKNSPNAILIIVTNPLDAMVFVASEVSKFPKNRVIGMAGVLDSARYRTFIAQELKVSGKDVEAMVLGGHGDSMVPLTKYTTVNKKPISELLPKEKIDALIDRTRKGGAEIVNLLKTGSAFYAPASSATEMVEAILKDSKKTLPCCVYCEKEYDVGGYFVGVPVKLGSKGVEEVVEIDLTEEEKKAFDKSTEHVKDLIKATEKLL